MKAYLLHIPYPLRFFLVVLILALLGSCSSNHVAEQEVTFNNSIAGIIYQNCTPCHRKEQVGRFPLLTYEDVKKNARAIQLAVQKKFMPPWPADPTYTHFAGEKVLSEDTIRILSAWIDNGCPQGNLAEAPPVPVFNDSSLFGKPDVVVKMRPVFLKGDNKDKFMLMKVPFEIPRDTFIRLIEFVPDNRKLLHHVNGHLIRYEYHAKKNIYAGEHTMDMGEYDVDIPSAYEKMSLSNDDGTYPVLKSSAFNFLPGAEPTLYPEGIGHFKVNRESAIFLKDIHYGPTSVDTVDQSVFNIFYAKGPARRPTHELQLGTFGTPGTPPIHPPLLIPPDTVMKFTVDYKIPGDISVLTINPHMHLIGKKFLAYALHPNGDTIRLIKIDNWDFRWQYFYTYRNPVKIPANAVIHVEGIYDNTVNNPFNPHHPPREVSGLRATMKTSDEMFQFIITYMLYKPGDEHIRLDKTRL